MKQKRHQLDFQRCGRTAAAAALLCGGIALAQGRHTGSATPVGGTISGTVLDAEGVPQMGALVQLLAADATPAASALTDARGHYRLTELMPGSYRMQVSAALFLPTVREHLHVLVGSRSVVNLTMSTLLSTAWLPAARRTGAESDDDWMWTLRSASMRPVLRLVDESGGNPLSVSTSATDSRAIRTQGRIAVHDSEGGFARGGTHQVLSVDRRNGDKSIAFLRADLSGPRTPFPVGPSSDVSIGWERRLYAGGISRSVVSYSSHPEVQDSRGANGLTTAVFRNAERVELGDLLRVDAGSVMRDANIHGNVLAVEPFARASMQLGRGFVVAYTFTRSRGTESLEDLDRVQAELPRVTERNGQLQMERGRHEALSLAGRSAKGGVIEVAIYRDALRNPLVAGTGILAAADFTGVAALSDPTTESFALRARDYEEGGVRVVVRQPVSDAVTLNAAFSNGRALNATTGPHASLVQLMDGLLPQDSITATLGISGKFVRTGTKVHAGYRWQPAGNVTPVDSFADPSNDAFLHCQLRQSLHAIPVLPQGLEAVVEVQNLLAEGYRPFVSQDGRTLYLAQSPRVLQAGLAFSF